jgi:streptomycin 6-kinase
MNACDYFYDMNTLKSNVLNLWGSVGEKWLNSLPSIIKTLSQYWSLTNIKPVTNMSWNYVATAIQKNTTPVAVKISCDKQLIQDEYKVLKYYNGHGAIKILDFNTEHNALLLEQAVPGCSLKEYHPLNIKYTINIYAQVIKKLASSSLYDINYIHASKWCQAINRIKDQRIDKHFIGKAKELKTLLLETAQNEYICHGDLHLENIIRNKKNWLVIDPKGIIGEMAFEAAAFDIISKDEMRNALAVPKLILSRATALAQALNLDLNRLLAWIFLRIIISAQWFFEDNGDPGYMLALANYVYPLLSSSAQL